MKQLDAPILDALRLGYPHSVRHVFHPLSDPRMPEPVEKAELGYRQVQDRAVKLRRSRTLEQALHVAKVEKGSAQDYLGRLADIFEGSQ